MRGFEHTDPAKRVCDTYTLHKVADWPGNLGKWFAVALADGTSDNILYDSKPDAIRHQHHNENYYAFIQVTPAQMTPCTAEIFLAGVRKLYDAGLRMTDPVIARKEVIKRATYEDQVAQSLHMRTQNLTFNPN
jgi:hypothetical protein